MKNGIVNWEALDDDQVCFGCLEEPMTASEIAEAGKDPATRKEDDPTFYIRQDCFSDFSIYLCWPHHKATKVKES